MSLTAINLGIQTNQCYLQAQAADVFVNFEGSYATYVNAYGSNPAWVDSAPASRFWHLVYATPDSAAMRHAICLSKQRNAGYVYVTNDVLPNPWDTLPAGPPADYWTAELQATASSSCG